MTITQALRHADKRLRKVGITSSILDSEVLLSHVLKQDKTYLLAHGDEVLEKVTLKSYNELIARRIKHEPVAYIVGHKDFFGMTFHVNQNVLIPRPESELLVEEAMKYLAHKKTASIADIGTGSGAIILALAKHASGKFSYMATDISEKALDVAKKNADMHTLSKKVVFKKGDLLSPLGKKKMNIIIANLPYLSDEIYEDSHTHAELEFEPKSALVAPDHGLKLIKKLLQQAPNHLKKGGLILLEISPEQAVPLQAFVEKTFKNAKIDFIKDLCNMPRLAKISI